MEAEINEALLQSWIRMSLIIRGNRVLSTLSFNEIVVAGILYRAMQDGRYGVTATELCSETRLLKSQVNKILTEMENKQFIERIRSEHDRRKIYIRICPDKVNVYLDEHERTIGLANAVSEGLGRENAIRLTELMNNAVQIFDSVNRED